MATRNIQKEETSAEQEIKIIISQETKEKFDKLEKLITEFTSFEKAVLDEFKGNKEEHTVQREVDKIFRDFMSNSSTIINRQNRQIKWLSISLSLLSIAFVIHALTHIFG